MSTPTLRIGGLPPIQVSGGTLVTLVVLAVIVHLSVSGGALAPATAVLLSVGVAVFMILSVLVHELGHALLARAAGGRVDHIALTLWGGHTQYRGDGIPAVGSVLISLAGPAGNLVLAGLAQALALVTDPGGAASLFWSLCASLNLALAVFNLLPGLPMDGGRALEAGLGAVLSSRATGTRITAWIGRGIAVAVVVLPLLRLLTAERPGTASVLVLAWALMIAAMLWQGSGRALDGARVQERVEALRACDLAGPIRLHRADDPVAVLDAGPPGAPPEQGTAIDDPTVLVLDRPRPGGPVRLLRPDPAAVRAVPAALRGSTALGAVSSGAGVLAELPAHLEGERLVSAMLDTPATAYLVREEDGTVVGVILSARVQELLRGR